MSLIKGEILMEEELKNYMEDIVFSALESVLNDIQMCTCQLCKMDVAAIALNSLPPKYVVTSKGKLYTKINTLQQQFDVDTLAAITKAAVMVKRNPRHE